MKNMRRGYTFESYMKIVENIREKCPDASITGDIIVGFPGEVRVCEERSGAEEACVLDIDVLQTSALFLTSRATLPLQFASLVAERFGC